MPIAEAEQQMNTVDAGMDPVQRLQRDLEREVPRAGAEVPRVQLIQHPGDEGRRPRAPGCEADEAEWQTPSLPGRCRPTTSGDRPALRVTRDQAGQSSLEFGAGAFAIFL